MNLIYFNPSNKIVYTICRNIVDIPTLTEGMALTEKDFPQDDLGVGNEYRIFYDVTTDEITYEVIKRPLNTEEQLKLLFTENQTLKDTQSDIQIALAEMMGM